MKALKSKLTKGDNKYFFKMFKFMKPYAIRYAITQFIYSAQGFAFMLMFGIFTGNIMTSIIEGDYSMVVNAGVTLGVMLIAFIAIMLFGVYINIVSIERAMMDLKRQLFRTFMRTGIEDMAHSGEGIASINTDANTAEGVFGNSLMMLLNNAITFVGAAVTILVMDWRLGLASLVVGALSFIMQHRFTEPLARVGREQLEANADSLKEASNVFSGAMAIRAYNMQPQAFLTFDKENRRIKALNIKQGFIRMGQNLFQTVEGWLNLVVVFGFGGWLAATGRVDFPVLATVFVMSSSLTSSIGQIGASYAGLQPHIAGAKRVFKILEKDGVTSEHKGTDFSKKASGYEIEIKNFNFRYLDSEIDVLKEINLKIAENKMVALVGESGSGKSTLLRAIIGMYEREEIGISVGDLTFAESSLRNWRQNFAYVDQSCKLFDLSIKQNIAMGAAGIAVSDEDIIKASKRAAAHSFIEEFEEGYDTPCGEKGSTLSGGQKQRIAIARALVKQAPILVFDEATSALDKESERHIMETINSLRQDHTILLTTHNLENVISADMIVVLDNGKVAEIGTHEELVAKGGVYHNLCSHNS
ncbi:MAG: ABC transporter ATP-binding protein/permease [Defluviitaleaceae bacterium]|nr:ABC transporter ATP-binding protein/permease [Defluviitaleaceae bacterium]